MLNKVCSRDKLISQLHIGLGKLVKIHLQSRVPFFVHAEHGRLLGTILRMLPARVVVENCFSVSFRLTFGSGLATG